METFCAIHQPGPLDFIARLAALVPKPRVNLTRFHGVFAPHSKHRALVTPAGRGPGRTTRTTRSPDERHAAMTWAYPKGTSSLSLRLSSGRSA